MNPRCTFSLLSAFLLLVFVRSASSAMADEPQQDAATKESDRQLPLDAFDPRPAWDAAAGFAIGSDSNPNLLSDDFRLPSFDGERLVEGSEPDSFFQLNGQTSYQPARPVRGWRWGAAAQVRRSFHQDFDELDLELFQGAVHVARGKDPLGFLNGPLGTARVPFGRSRSAVLVQVGLSYARLGGRSYLRRSAGAVSLVLWESAATATQLDLELADSRFFIEPPLPERDRSGEDFTLRVSQSCVIGRRDRWLRIGALAGERVGERASTASRGEVWAELALPVAAGWTLSLGAAAGREEYAHSESNLFAPAGPSREDDLFRASAAVVWVLPDGWRWTLRGMYVQHDSSVDLGPDLPDLGYERNLVSTGVTWSF